MEWIAIVPNAIKSIADGTIMLRNFMMKAFTIIQQESAQKAIKELLMIKIRFKFRLNKINIMITNPKDLKKLLKQNALIVKNIIKLAQKENLIPDNDRQNVISEVQDLLMEFDNLLSRFTKMKKILNLI